MTYAPALAQLSLQRPASPTLRYGSQQEIQKSNKNLFIQKDQKDPKRQQACTSLMKIGDKGLLVHQSFFLCATACFCAIFSLSSTMASTEIPWACPYYEATEWHSLGKLRYGAHSILSKCLCCSNGCGRVASSRFRSSQWSTVQWHSQEEQNAKFFRLLNVCVKQHLPSPSGPFASVKAKGFCLVLLSPPWKALKTREVGDALHRHSGAWKT